MGKDEGAVVELRCGFDEDNSSLWHFVLIRDGKFKFKIWNSYLDVSSVFNYKFVWPFIETMTLFQMGISWQICVWVCNALFLGPYEVRGSCASSLALLRGHTVWLKNFAKTLDIWFLVVFFPRICLSSR